jgi:hypothetical protein
VIILKIDYYFGFKALLILILLIIFMFLASCSSDKNQTYQYQQYDSYLQSEKNAPRENRDSQPTYINNPNQYQFPNSSYYSNPYALPPQNKYPYYDGDQYYVPPTYYAPQIN